MTQEPEPRPDGGGNSGDAPPDKNRRRRPWLPVLIACAVAAIVLIVILIPGVLVYPDADAGAADDAELAQIQRESNAALEGRVARLRDLLAKDICYADGSLTLPGPDGGRVPIGSEERAALPPIAPERTAVPRQSLPAQSDFEGSLVQLLDRATALVVTENGTGSAFFVGDGLAITNRHVLGNPPAATVKLLGVGLDGIVDARVVAHSPHGEAFSPDFALLELDYGAAALPLALTRASQRLQHVVASGYPGILLQYDEVMAQVARGDTRASPEPGLTQGEITTRQNPRGTEVIVHTATIRPGNSGGPLVDLCGRVVGVNTFAITDGRGSERVIYSLSSAALVTFLEQEGALGRVSVTSATCEPGPMAAAAAPGDDAQE